MFYLGLKDTDWAYLAGFFDGEGCVAIIETQRKRSRLSNRASYPYYQIRMVITNTDYLLLESLQQQFGGSIHIHCQTGERTSKQFQWMLDSRRKSEPVLRGMLPYLRYKNREVELALEFLCGVKPNNGGLILTPKEVERRQRIVRKIRSLPGRRGGPPRQLPERALRKGTK